MKSRQQIADEYGISRWTFDRWLKKAGISLPSGLISPVQQQLIYDTLGDPEKIKEKRKAI